MSHFSAGACVRMMDGVRQFLIVRYYRNKSDFDAKRNVQIKFPGGTNKEFADAKPADTLRREFIGETGLEPPQAPVQVHVTSKPSREGGGLHTQHFFLFGIEECRGSLRTEPMNDDGDWLDVPEWMDEIDLARLIFKSHEPAFDKSIAKLSRER